MNLVHSDTVDPECYDPDDLPTNFRPAVIEVLDGDDTTNYITVANVAETEAGNFRCIEWEGRTIRLPAWRVCEVAYLQTAFRHDDGGTNALPDEWREVREDDREYVPPLDAEDRVGVTEVGP